MNTTICKNTKYSWLEIISSNVTFPKGTKLIYIAPEFLSGGSENTSHIGTEIFSNSSSLTYIITHETCDQSVNNHQAIRHGKQCRVLIINTLHPVTHNSLNVKPH